MPRYETLAIDVGRTRLQAVTVGHGRRGTMAVTGRLEQAIPDGIDREDPAAVGAWVARVLADAGLARGRAVIALAREHVSLRTLQLPTADAAELPDMVRLAIQRDLPIDAETAAIDFVVIDQDERSTTVLAAAAPSAVVDHASAIAAAAGLRAARVGLRCLGMRSLFGGMDLGVDSALGVDLAGDDIELILTDGPGADGLGVRFSRGVALRTPLDDSAEAAEIVSTETRRTWLSYRVSRDEDEAGVRRVVVLGSPEIASVAAPSIASIVGAPAEILQRHPRIDAGDAPLGSMWALAGLLLASGAGGDTIDLAHPRKAPDTAAQRRQGVLAAVAVVVIAALAGYTIGRQQARREISGQEDLIEKAKGATTEAYRFRRDELKIEHLDRWMLPEDDWTLRVSAMTEALPPPGDAVLDTVVARRDCGPVRWDRTDGWSLVSEIRLVMEGEARTRRLADDLRLNLVDNSGYSVSTAGSDARGGSRLPFAFGYTLRAAERRRGDDAPRGAEEGS